MVPSNFRHYPARGSCYSLSPATTRRILLGVFVILAMSVCSVDTVQAAYVWIQADSLAYWCDATDNVPGPRDIYVVHVGSSSGVRFKLEMSPGLTWSYVSEVHYTPALEGDALTGITFCYGQCEPDVLLMKVTFMTYGTSEECSDIRVVPHPESDAIDELTCDGSAGFAWGNIFYVSSIPCDESQCPAVYYGPPSNPYDFCQPVPTDRTTWGAIKSLYQH